MADDFRPGLDPVEIETVRLVLAKRQPGLTVSFDSLLAGRRVLEEREAIQRALMEEFSAEGMEPDGHEPNDYGRLLDSIIGELMYF